MFGIHTWIVLLHFEIHPPYFATTKKGLQDISMIEKNQSFRWGVFLAETHLKSCWLEYKFIFSEK